MPTLTAKGAATRRRIIEGAAELIRDAGLESATLEEIRLATSTSKSQLFHYFPDGRRQLLLAVARHEADRVLADQQPHLSELASWDAWQRWRDAVVARYRRQGRTCPMATLLTDVGRNDPASQEVTRNLLLRWRLSLRDGILALQRAQNGAPDIDADRYAGALIAAIQGGVAVLLATGSSEDLEAVLDLLLEPLKPRGGRSAGR